MPITFTAGYIEVWREGVMISRHRAEREAVEAILSHAETATDGEYEIRPAPVKVNVKRRITGPDAPALGPVLTISSTELTLTLDRAATGPTRIDRYEIERLVGSTWTQIASGLNIFSASNQYPDTGLLPSTTYQYRCRAVDTTERASEYSYASGTTSAGATNSAPVWQSGTIAVSAQAGSSVSVSSYCSDPEGDPLVFSLIDTTPTDSTITVTANGTIQTTSATQVTTNAVVVRASDGVLTATKTISLTVTPVASGNTFYIEPGVPEYNASQVQPGDTIILRSGTRGPLTINNANGSASGRITIRPETGAVTTIRGSGGFLFLLNGPSYVTVDGTLGGDTYGIVIETTTSTTAATALFKVKGRVNNFTMRGVECNGKRTSWVSAVTPTGIDFNDATVVRGAGAFREIILIEQCYVHNVAGEGMYVGPNFAAGGMPFRNVTIRYNTVQYCGRDGINYKGWWEGANAVHGNTVQHTGQNTNDPQVGQRQGISTNNGFADVYDNIVQYTNESGIKFFTQNGPTAGATFDGYGPYTSWTCNVYNNLVTNTGQSRGAGTGHGITFGSDPGLVPHLPHVYNNTVVDCNQSGIIASGDTVNGFCRNNVVVGNGSTITGSALNAANNKTDSANFNSTTYRLTAESAAVGTPGTDISLTDLEGTSRSGTASKGAYEFA